jgi:predicted transcriptional regulator
MSQGEGGGRPTKYEVRFNRLAYKLSLLGASDKEIADSLEVSEATLYLWKNTYPKFSEAIKNGKEKADSAIAESLYKRANGYSHKDVDIKVVSDGQGQGSSIVQTPIIKH